MMDVKESNFADVLDDSPVCCIFSSFCRFCKNSKVKCYVQERVFVGWSNFYLKFVGLEIHAVSELWDWTFFLALLDGLDQEKRLLDESSTCSKTGLHYNWDIVQDYLIKEKVVKSLLTNGKLLIERKKFTYWLTEILWSLIFRHYFDLKPGKMNRKHSIDYRRASHSLIRWIKRKVPDCELNDLFFDLRDGAILCKLINSIVQNTIDASVWEESEDAEDVVSYAMQAAQEVLGIPYLITPEELVDCDVDEKSIITYIALYRSADRMLSRGISLVSKRSDIRADSVLNDLNKAQFDHTSRQHPRTVQKVNKQNIAYGFGIHYGQVGKPTEFIVHLSSFNKGDLSVLIKCIPDNERAVALKAEPKIKPLGDTSTGSSYMVSYTPVRSGNYEISVLCGKKHIFNSPFTIKVQEPTVQFRCLSESDQKLTIEPVSSQQPDSDYLIFSDDSSVLDYSPVGGRGKRNTGLMSDVLSDSDDNVFFNDSSKDNHLNENFRSLSPSATTSGYSTSEASLKKSEESYVSQGIGRCIATGMGLYSGEVGVMSHFEVRTPNSGCGPLSVIVTCPAMSIPSPHVNTRSENDILVHDVMYLPTEPGNYAIEVKWGNKIVADSPYHLHVEETSTLCKDNFADLNELFDASASSAIIFYSATSCNKHHQRRTDYLASVISGCFPQLRTKFVPVDLELSANQRRNLFSLSKDRTLPLVVLNRKYLGNYNTLVGLYKSGQLKEHINEVIGDLSLYDDSLSNFADIQTLNNIKNTLSNLKYTLSDESMTLTRRCPSRT